MDGAADGTKRGLAAACGYTEGLHAIRPNGTVLDPADIECLVEAFQSALQVTAGEGGTAFGGGRGVRAGGNIPRIFNKFGHSKNFISQ